MVDVFYQEMSLKDPMVLIAVLGRIYTGQFIQQNSHQNSTKVVDQIEHKLTEFLLLFNAVVHSE